MSGKKIIATDNHSEARRDIKQCIVDLYNPGRLHSTLGYLSPVANG